MLAFSRLTSVIFFVLSLSLFAYAAPTPAYDSSAVAPTHDGLVGLLVELKAKVDFEAKEIVGATTVVGLAAKVDVLVTDVTACANAIAALGANIDLDAAVEADIAVKVAAIITVIVQACISVIAKFGILVVLTLLAKIDICLNLLLTNLGVCVEGIITLVAQIVVKLGVSVFAQVHLGLCLNVLGLIGVSL